MPTSQSLGGLSRSGKIIAPSLDRIIKNVAWRKNSQLVEACKSVIDKLESVVDVDDLDHPPLYGFTVSDADLVLEPLVIALDSGSIKVLEPAIDCVSKLLSFRLLGGGIDRVAGGGGGSTVVFRILEAVCKCCALGDEGVELCVLRTLLSAIRSPCLLIRGDYLLHMIRTCYNVYLGSSNGTNKICAKSALAQIMVIVFSRVEEDSMDVNCHTVSVYSLLEFTDKNLNEGSSIQFSQNFLNDIMESGEVTADVKHKLSPAGDLQNDNAVGSKMEENGDITHGDRHDASNSTDQSKIREDGFMVFKNICKLSMKFSSQEHTDDNILLSGKIISLELLKVVMDNAGPIWQSNERFLGSIKQYLCLSLLKNSALSVMTIFQLLCSIFMSLLKFRSVLKAEIGIFFPMLMLRVLENVLQPSFLQKMIVLNILQKISQDSQIVIDIFVNYDCDVDSPNIFERIVNGLLKTALGPPAGSTSTLTAAQDSAFQVESVACLVHIIKSMGDWMDQQLKSNDSIEKRVEGFVSCEHHTTLDAEEGICDHELHLEPNTELSDAATLEQRRTYKIELQEGITLFNRKPHKGIEFLIRKNKIGGSPEEVSTFMKSTSRLNKTLIGDYLGERDEFCLKVMHAYVDSFNFDEKDFGEALRYFLQGFRLPGEAQKIDRIMEKFAERYCKCNPTAFTSAGTAYVLAYSVIMLNTDAHNDMVKDKMTKDDFVRNNRGIDNGKDLHEVYLGSLYDQIVKNEIKLKADSSVFENKQSNGFNKLLGLDGILNLVRWRQDEEKPLGANGALIRHIQEQFKAKSGKPGNIYYTLSDVAILRFMVEVCWGPMLAAFSVIIDQSDDKASTSLCLQGFRLAIHVTSVIGMPTQRDAFVTTLAKFTYLHCAADMKQKNVDAVKTIISVAIEDGNYLLESWEHILTCLSRFEHLQLLGEGVPSDMSFFSSGETEERTPRSIGFPSLKKKGTIQDPAMIAVVRGSSYDSTTPRFQSSNFVTPEQINHFILNLNILDQVGSFELNHIFGHSQSLNSEAIVAFVKALCKVSVSELQSPTDPRVFSLTKIVEISHYNMNRIRLVWSHIWAILSEFFVSVGLSENLSVAIFVMDSLRQLAMKFLEREELANYNFQNEFLRPFVIVMEKSDSVEIRELIIRCISQMVLSRVSNIKSGWKSVFMIFTAAAADETKSIVLLAFETMERIVREYFPYITETETSTFTDCVGCLLTFTNSTFNKDVSLNAIAFLRFCAVKLADGMLVSYDKSKEIDSISPNQNTSSGSYFIQKEDHVAFWIPMLTGLSKLASDTRSAIRKSSLKVLFNILKDHGHLFSQSFWLLIFRSIIMPIFGSTVHSTGIISESRWTEGSTWDSETSSIATQCLADLFINFFNIVRSQLPNVVSALIGFIHSPVHSDSGTGIAALVHLAGELRTTLSEEEWREFFLALREASASSLPGVSTIMGDMYSVELPEIVESHIDVQPSDEIFASDLDDDNLQTAAYVISRLKNHIAAELLVEQVATELYTMSLRSLTAPTIRLILELFTSVASQAVRLTSRAEFRTKIQKACTYLETSEPPLVHFETESSLNSLTFLHKLSALNPLASAELRSESLLVTECETILNAYMNCGRGEAHMDGPRPSPRRVPPPLGSAQKEELGSRSGSAITALRALSGLTEDSFRRYVSRLFPLLVGLVPIEHSSVDVQNALTYVFESCIGPVIIN